MNREIINNSSNELNVEAQRTIGYNIYGPLVKHNPNDESQRSIKMPVLFKSDKASWTGNVYEVLNPECENEDDITVDEIADPEELIADPENKKYIGFSAVVEGYFKSLNKKDRWTFNMQGTDVYITGFGKREKKTGGKKVVTKSRKSIKDRFGAKRNVEDAAVNNQERSPEGNEENEDEIITREQLK